VSSHSRKSALASASVLKFTPRCEVWKRTVDGRGSFLGRVECAAEFDFLRPCFKVILFTLPPRNPYEKFRIRIVSTQSKKLFYRRIEIRMRACLLMYEYVVPFGNKFPDCRFLRLWQRTRARAFCGFRRTRCLPRFLTDDSFTLESYSTSRPRALPSLFTDKSPGSPVAVARCRIFLFRHASP